jgi:hypothetical protein
LEKARSLFDSVSQEWPKSHGLRRSTRAAVVAVSVVSLFGATTALAAASALPAPAARVVDSALHSVDINVSPPASPVATSANEPVSVTGALTPAASTQYRKHAKPVRVATRSTRAPLPASSSTKGHNVAGSNTALEQYRRLAEEAAAQGNSSRDKSAATKTKRGGAGKKSTGSGGGSASGSGKGHGGDRGGNHSTGSGGGSASGSGKGHGGDRGGNHSTGSGKKTAKRHHRKAGASRRDGTNKGAGSSEVNVSTGQ